MEGERFLQIAAVQYPVPNIHCPEEILPNTENICIVMERTKRFYPNFGRYRLSRILDAKFGQEHLGARRHVFNVGRCCCSKIADGMRNQ